jgi:hypothetical protein
MTTQKISDNFLSQESKSTYPPDGPRDITEPPMGGAVATLSRLVPLWLA